MHAAILAIVVALPAAAVLAQPRSDTPIVVFHTNDFWLNLHQFLYVLGRHEARMPDRTRRAVSHAPADATKGLATLSPEEQRRWHDAVAFYAAGPSRQDAVFDRPLIAVANVLARAVDSADLAGTSIDAKLRARLEDAAPIYRRAWWPAHRQSNEQWADTTRALVDRHGRALLAFITKAYHLPWPDAGYPVRVAAYANWAGAFSTEGNLLVISSLDPGTNGLPGLEITFHEAMHQWDDEIDAVLRAESTKQNRPFRDALSHAMIFYTAGEAMRVVAPDYRPYAEANGIWQRAMGAFKPALDAAWRPYLEGKGTREEALAALVAQ